MKRFLVFALIFAACGGSPSPTTVTVDMRAIVIEQVAAETSCDTLERSIGYDQKYLAKQAADPDYGMTETEVARADKSIELSEDRMAELGC